MALPNEKKESQSSEIPYNPVDSNAFMDDVKRIKKIITPNSQFIEERENEFDKEFPSPDGSDFIGMERITDLKRFLRQSLELQRQKFIEGIKGKVKRGITIDESYFNDGLIKAIEIIKSL